MSVLEIVLLAVVGELGLGIGLGRLLRGPRPAPILDRPAEPAPWPGAAMKIAGGGPRSLSR